MRCFALAEVIKNLNFDVCFISKRLEENIYDFISKKGYKIYYISNNNNHNNLIQNDVLDTKKIIKESKEKAAWVLVDHYDLDMEWESEIRKHVEKIIVIDDLANRKHNCDLLLDQNLYDNMYERYSNLVPTNCKILVGPKYALLRSKFLQVRENVKCRKTLENILISFGGSDPTNETSKVLTGIKKLHMKNTKISAVVRSTNQHMDEIKKLCSSINNCTLYCDVDNMEQLMISSDLAIGAGGTTTWERCCLGLPSIVSIIADNQTEQIKTMAEKKCVINLGDCKNLTPYDYEECVKQINSNMLMNMSSNCLEIVDGKGCFRVSEIMHSL